jgi:hypothetical protein
MNRAPFRKTLGPLTEPLRALVVLVRSGLPRLVVLALVRLRAVGVLARAGIRGLHRRIETLAPVVALQLLKATPALIRFVLLAAATAGAALLVVADFSTLRGVRALEADILHVRGGGQHLYTLMVLGVLAVPISLIAAIGRSRMAIGALVAAGFVAAFVVVAIDLPSLGSTARQDQLYASVRAWTGNAIYLEIAGATLLIVSGFVQLAYLHRRAGTLGRQRTSG